MADEVGLAIPVDIERLDLDSSIDRLFENAGTNGLAFDRDLAWLGDIDGQELHFRLPFTIAPRAWQRGHCSRRR